MAPMTAEQEIRLEAASYCAEQAAEAFWRADYAAACRWWIEASTEAVSVSGKRACIANAAEMWRLVPVAGVTVQ